MKVSCEVIKDLLPLYYDKVCSKESCSLIEEHLTECRECAAELQKLKADMESPSVPEEDMNAMKRISAAWRKDKKVAFTLGAMVVSALGAIICFISYFAIGAKVLPDGTLSEPFALIPIGYVFVGFFILSLALYLAFLSMHKFKFKANVKSKAK